MKMLMCVFVKLKLVGVYKIFTVEEEHLWKLLFISLMEAACAVAHS